MTNVLVVKANNRPDGISTKMYETFVAEAATVEGLNVTTFDVFEQNMPYFGQDLFNAFGKMQNGGELTEIESRSVAAMNSAREALTAAEVVVFAFPLWNQTIPAALQSFIDYTYGSGYTFKYNAQGQMESLMTDKKYIVLNARGGFYTEGPAAAMEMAVNYINRIAGDIYGMQKIEEVIIEGHNADRANAATIIADGLEKVKAAAKKLATVTA